MKIIFLNHSDRIGPRVNNEIKALSEKYTVEVLSWNWNKTKREPLKGKVKEEFINLNAPRGMFKLIFLLPLLYWKILKHLKDKKIDVFHCTHLFLLPISIFLGKIKKAKVVYDVYERHAITVSYRFSFLSGMMRKIIESIENKLVSKVAAVLTVDSPNKVLENRYKKYNSNVKALYNVPDLDITVNQDLSNKLKQKYKNRKIIIYIGGLSKDKGTLMTIRCTKILKNKFPQIKLLLIGFFHDSREKIYKLIKKFGLENNVEIINWLSYKNMLAYLSVAHIGLALHQPHKKFRFVAKGTGRKFFTFMHASLPIVGPEFAQIGQVVREQKCGLLVGTTNPQKIVKAIEYLLKNPDEAKKLGENGKKAILEKYNWKNENKKLFKVYDEMA